MQNHYCIILNGACIGISLAEDGIEGAKKKALSLISSEDLVQIVYGDKKDGYEHVCNYPDES